MVIWRICCRPIYIQKQNGLLLCTIACGKHWPRRVPRQLGRHIATPVAVPVDRVPQMCVRSTVLCCRANRRGLLMFCIPVANSGKTLLFRHEAVRLTFPNETRVTGSGCVPAHHRPSASLIRKGRSRRLWRDWAGGRDPWGGGGFTPPRAMSVDMQEAATGTPRVHIIRWAGRSNSRCHRLFPLRERAIHLEGEAGMMQAAWCAWYTN